VSRADALQPYEEAIAAVEKRRQRLRVCHVDRRQRRAPGEDRRDVVDGREGPSRQREGSRRCE
jgi:hypothetical protein